MKEYIEKLLLYLAPFLLLISICYNNGYWSLYPINIYDYYQVTDILKIIAMPAFSFISLAFFPLLIISIIVYLSVKLNESAATEPNENSKILELPKFFENMLDRLDKIALIKNKFFYIPITLLLLSGLGYAAIEGIASIWQLTTELSPYSDDKQFIEGYFYIVDKGSMRSIEACIIAPLAFSIATLMVSNPNILGPLKPIKNAVKIFLLTFSILATLTLSYNAGRIDAYKIIAGYDFYYTIDKKNGLHKYLGKLNKYFFFLDDNRIVKGGKLSAILGGHLPYSNRISIISEDSLKALRLNRYSPSIALSDSTYYKDFQIRKFDD